MTSQQSSWLMGWASSNSMAAAAAAAQARWGAGDHAPVLEATLPGEGHALEDDGSATLCTTRLWLSRNIIKDLSDDPSEQHLIRWSVTEWSHDLASKVFVAKRPLGLVAPASRCLVGS